MVFFPSIHFLIQPHFTSSFKTSMVFRGNCHPPHIHAQNSPLLLRRELGHQKPHAPMLKVISLVDGIRPLNQSHEIPYTQESTTPIPTPTPMLTPTSTGSAPKTICLLFGGGNNFDICPFAPNPKLIFCLHGELRSDNLITGGRGCLRAKYLLVLRFIPNGMTIF